MGLPLMAFEQACVMTKFVTYTSYTLSDKNSCISQATTWLMYMSHLLACKLASSKWAILTKRFLMQVEFLALNALPFHQVASKSTREFDAPLSLWLQGHSLHHQTSCAWERCPLDQRELGYLMASIWDNSAPSPRRQCQEALIICGVMHAHSGM